MGILLWGFTLAYLFGYKVGYSADAEYGYFSTFF